VTADQRRRAVPFLRAGRHASVARACRLVGIGRSSYAYTSRRAERDAPVRARMRVLAGQRPRWVGRAAPALAPGARGTRAEPQAHGAAVPR
jgi:hypothetical protein